MTALLEKHDSHAKLTRRHLRSGLYFAFDPAHVEANPARVFLIYWPEDTTWDDNAVSSVCKNRVTFMRYV